MSTFVILYLWVVTATHQFKSYPNWVASGTYVSVDACRQAATQLGLSGDGFRCITGAAKP
jgi:hypothetical protein